MAATPSSDPDLKEWLGRDPTPTEAGLVDTFAKELDTSTWTFPETQAYLEKHEQELVESTKGLAPSPELPKLAADDPVLKYLNGMMETPEGKERLQKLCEKAWETVTSTLEKDALEFQEASPERRRQLLELSREKMEASKARLLQEIEKEHESKKKE